MPNKNSARSSQVKVIAADKSPEEKKTNLHLVVASLLFLIALAVIGYLYFNLKTLEKGTELKPADFNKEKTPVQKEIPTLTPERIEIIKQMETHTITIQSETLTPETVTIRTHDQVRWENLDASATYQITGEGWGGVPINPGERFTQAFSETGRFPYFDDLNPEINGIIIVE